MNTCQSNAGILRTNMGLKADCRKYIYTRDHVNNLVDVREIIKYTGKYIGHVGLQCSIIKLYQTNTTQT